MEPLVSVIVPVYNVHLYLEECVYSILHQTYKNLEIILVDDGSTDGSGALCDELAKNDVRIAVYHKKNGGLSDARNYGLDRAKGDYLTFVDSDDTLEWNAITEMLNASQKENADMVICNISRWQNGKKSMWLPTRLGAGTYTKERLLTETLKGKSLNISVLGKLFSNEIFKSLRFTVGIKFEDYDITPRLFSNAEHVAYCPSDCYLYRVNPSSIMQTNKKYASLDIITVTENVLTQLRAIYGTQFTDECRWWCLKRVWKWVGIIDTQKGQKENAVFLHETRLFLKKYWPALRCCSAMSKTERIGVWTFCFLPCAYKVLAVIRGLHRK